MYNDLLIFLKSDYPKFDSWWRKKYGYFTLQGEGLIKFWVEYLVDTGLYEEFQRLLDIEVVLSRWKDPNGR